MKTDYAISSKPITGTVWVLIFTSKGKYFFLNSQNGERCWIPPESVLKTLKEKFTPSAREMFFDPFYQEEKENERSGDEEDDKSDNNTDNNSYNNNDDHDGHNATATSNSVDQKPSYKPVNQVNDIDEAEDEFKLYLLKHSIDPFAPWPTILSLHSNSSQFQAIASDKRRQDLFAQVCPLLIEKKREDSKRKAEEAKRWWCEAQQEYLKMGFNWFQVIKTVKLKANSKFALLNEKECEKEYKNLLNKRR